MEKKNEKELGLYKREPKGAEVYLSDLVKEQADEWIRMWKANPVKYKEQLELLNDPEEPSITVGRYYVFE